MRSPLLDAPWTQKGGAPEAAGSGQLRSTWSAWTINGTLQWVRTVLLACAGCVHEQPCMQGLVVSAWFLLECCYLFTCTQRRPFVSDNSMIIIGLEPDSVKYIDVWYACKTGFTHFYLNVPYAVCCTNLLCLIWHITMVDRTADSAIHRCGRGATRPVQRAVTSSAWHAGAVKMSSFSWILDSRQRQHHACQMRDQKRPAQDLLAQETSGPWPGDESGPVRQASWPACSLCRQPGPATRSGNHIDSTFGSKGLSMSILRAGDMGQVLCDPSTSNSGTTLN
jgi:hypothetical protein